jgi:hypothetical protein
VIQWIVICCTFCGWNLTFKTLEILNIGNGNFNALFLSITGLKLLNIHEKAVDLF